MAFTRGTVYRAGRRSCDPSHSSKVRSLTDKIAVNVHLNILLFTVIFCDGYEREDYRSAHPSCRSFPGGAHADGNAFSHGFRFLRSIHWGWFAQWGDYRINQPTRKRGKRIA